MTNQFGLVHFQKWLKQEIRKLERQNDVADVANIHDLTEEYTNRFRKHNEIVSNLK